MFIRRALVVIGLIAGLVSVNLSSAKSAASSTLAFPPPLVEASKIKAADLLISAQKLLPKGGFLGPLLDDKYTVISHEWLKKKFLPFYRDAVTKLKDVAARDDEGADCDDYGMFLRQMIGMAGIVGHSDEPAAAQLIVFQAKAFSGVEGTHERHSVGLFLTDKGWFVLEPQNGADLVPIESYANRRGIQYMTFH